jgi:hypothetical protein
MRDKLTPACSVKASCGPVMTVSVSDCVTEREFRLYKKYLDNDNDSQYHGE